MAEFEALWTRLVPETPNGERPGPEKDRMGNGETAAREYAAAATYERFSRTCRLKSSAGVFRDLAAQKRTLARRLMAEQFLKTGVRAVPGGALYARPVPEALRGMYLYELETAGMCGEGPQRELAERAAEQLRTLLETMMP